MTKKSNTLINERVIRRWGKLANMPALTENFIGSLEEEEMEDELAAAGDEIAAGEAEVEAGEEAEASVEEQEAVEAIVSAVVDAISAETGVDIEVEGGADDEGAMDDLDAGMDASDELDDAADGEMDALDAANREPYNRKDITETGAKRDGESKGDKGKDKEDPEDRDYSGKGMRKGDESDTDKGDKDFTWRKGKKSKTHSGVDETLEIDVVDDEALTEAVLARVVERLLKQN
jgi:hypothetical protein